MRTRALLLTLALLSTALAGCLDGGQEPHGDAHVFNGLEYDPAAPAPDFTLTDQHGNTVTLADFEDKVVVVAFTYTTCPDVCLAVEASLLSVQTEMGDEDGYVILSITIDPARDTPEHLAAWTEARGYTWPHLTSADHSVLQDVWSDWHLLVDNDHIGGDHGEHSDTGHHEMTHKVSILYPDNTTTTLNHTLTGWSLTTVALDQAGIALNGSGGQWGHFVNGIGGVDSPADWSWWWGLHVWNASNSTWDESPTGIDGIEMTDSTHIAWAASSANTSDLPAPMDGHHSVDVLYPNGTHERAMLSANVSGWDTLLGATADADLTMNASDGQWGHFVNGFNGTDSPSDWSWWWSMLFWNATSMAWEESPVGLDDLRMMVDTDHIAFAASNANLSQLPAPVAMPHDDEEDHGEMEEEMYLVGHNTVTFIIDLDGNKRIVFSGSDWDPALFAEDLEHLIHHDRGVESAEPHGH